MKKSKESNLQNNGTNQEEIIVVPLGFYKKLWYSITKFEKYPELATNGVGRAIKYLIQLIAIFAIVLTMGITYNFVKIVNKGIDYIENYFPGLSYESGKLIVDQEEAITIEEESFGKIIIDTTIDGKEKSDEYVSDLDSKYGMVCLSEEVIVKSSEKIVTYSYKDILDTLKQDSSETYTKQQLIDIMKEKGLKILYGTYFISMYIYTFTIYVLSTLLDTFILSILGVVTSFTARIKMNYKAIFNMSIYALTLPIILNATYITVNMFLPFVIKYFTVMYTAIAYIYLATAIFIIKSDFLKKKTEINKTIVIEKENQEKQEKNEEQEDNNKEQENEKKDDNKKENNKGNDVPEEGANA